MGANTFIAQLPPSDAVDERFEKSEPEKEDDNQQNPGSCDPPNAESQDASRPPVDGHLDYQEPLKLDHDAPPPRAAPRPYRGIRPPPTLRLSERKPSGRK